jgi:hypothetical protein
MKEHSPCYGCEDWPPVLLRKVGRVLGFDRVTPIRPLDVTTHNDHVETFVGAIL